MMAKPMQTQELKSLVETGSYKPDSRDGAAKWS